VFLYRSIKQSRFGATARVHACTRGRVGVTARCWLRGKHQQEFSATRPYWLLTRRDNLRTLGGAASWSVWTSWRWRDLGMWQPVSGRGCVRPRRGSARAREGLARPREARGQGLGGKVPSAQLTLPGFHDRVGAAGLCPPTLRTTSTPTRPSSFGLASVGARDRTQPALPFAAFGRAPSRLRQSAGGFGNPPSTAAGRRPDPSGHETWQPLTRLAALGDLSPLRSAPRGEVVSGQGSMIA